MKSSWGQDTSFANSRVIWDKDDFRSDKEFFEHLDYCKQHENDWKPKGSAYVNACKNFFLALRDSKNSTIDLFSDAKELSMLNMSSLLSYTSPDPYNQEPISTWDLVEIRSRNNPNLLPTIAKIIGEKLDDIRQKNEVNKKPLLETWKTNRAEELKKYPLLEKKSESIRHFDMLYSEVMEEKDITKEQANKFLAEIEKKVSHSPDQYHTLISVMNHIIGTSQFPTYDLYNPIVRKVISILLPAFIDSHSKYSHVFIKEMFDEKSITNKGRISILFSLKEELKVKFSHSHIFTSLIDSGYLDEGDIYKLLEKPEQTAENLYGIIWRWRNDRSPLLTIKNIKKILCKIDDIKQLYEAIQYYNFLPLKQDILDLLVTNSEQADWIVLAMQVMDKIRTKTNIDFEFYSDLIVRNKKHATTLCRLFGDLDISDLADKKNIDVIFNLVEKSSIILSQIRNQGPKITQKVFDTILKQVSGEGSSEKVSLSENSIFKSEVQPSVREHKEENKLNSSSSSKVPTYCGFKKGFLNGKRF